jgi:hypothetical protein
MSGLNRHSVDEFTTTANMENKRISIVRFGGKLHCQKLHTKFLTAKNISVFGIA